MEVGFIAAASKFHWKKFWREGCHQVGRVVAVELDALDHPLAEERLQEGEELVEHPRVVHEVDCSEPERVFDKVFQKKTLVKENSKQNVPSISLGLVRMSSFSWLFL